MSAIAVTLMPAQIILNEKDFAFFQNAIGRIAGISMNTSKRELIEARLRPRVHALGLSDFPQYRAKLEKAASDDPEWQTFTNLLTTNKTDFFREPRHFDFLLEEHVPQLLAGGHRKLKIWSAACSTGEEPYTLAMVLSRALQGRQADFEILATDIDSKVLSTASNGVYRTDRIRSQIPEDYFAAAINFGRDGISDWARISPKLRQRIEFQSHNLISNERPTTAPFDIIFLRNVLIYFTPDTIRQVVEKLYETAKPGALLFIGHSESLNSIPTSWKSVGPSIYIKGA